MTALLPDTARTVWLWAGHAAYLGPSFHLDMHSTSVHCLALGVDAPFIVTTPDLVARQQRSVLIPPRTRHRIDAGAGRMLFVYVDPRSVHTEHLRAAMRDRSTVIASTHRAEDELLTALRHGVGPEQLDRILFGDNGSGADDDRIRHAMEMILADPAAELGADQLAAAVDLSTSRFLHLFTATAGTSFRRYRLWSRMLSVAAAVADGSDLTTAAIRAGFASPSHFSDTFHAMFGLTATSLLSQGTTIVVRR
ncbi:helix-turn-helix domain-containing protein [Nocardia sp. NBC_00511]|uniref:helix-turn-helix domain-containing protein n=1 Tax=Nocardia sp. NBC_00511 TaxID=2903591 RepID=UPI0030E1FFF6